MSRLNKTVKFHPAQSERGSQVTGTIVWVHPKRRFVLVEYSVQSLYGGLVTMRECLPLVQGQLWAPKGSQNKPESEPEPKRRRKKVKK